MPSKQSGILAIAVWITGFIIALMGVNVVDPNGNTTALGGSVGMVGIIIFFSGFVFLFLPEIGTWISSR